MHMHKYLRPQRHPSPNMALFIEGIPVSSVSFAPTPKTVLSASFFQTLSRDSSRLLLTTPVHPHGSCSTVLECAVSATSQFDVVLGNDWAALLRGFLVSVGYRLPSPFDPWPFLLSNQPISHSAVLGSTISSSSNSASQVSTSGASSSHHVGPSNVSSHLAG
jgi:hypothetical protein